MGHYNFTEPLIARQKYTVIVHKTMYDTPVFHMRALFGLDPDILPHGLHFPRLPPGLIHPMTSRFTTPDPRVIKDAAVLAPRLEDFQQAYQKRASALIESQDAGITYPGHPLYNRQASVGMLKSENDKLLKENLELKKQIDQTRDKHAS